MVSQKAYKIMLIGSIAVGKTSIANRIAHDHFSGDYKSTIGVQLYPTTLDVNGESVKVILWDTDGDMRAEVFKSPYIKGAAGVLIVCDTQRPQTYENMLDLSDQVDDQLPGRPHVCVFNKIDLQQPSDDMWVTAKKHGRIVTGCSALNGEGVLNALQTLVEQIMLREE